MEIRTEKNIKVDQLLSLYNSVNLKTYTSEPEKLHRAIRNSTYVVTCWDNDKLIGLARGMSDNISIFYLQDILVSPNYQGKGIWTKLLKHCLEKHKDVRHKVLITDYDERIFKFYEALGFKNLKKLKKHDINAFLQFNYVNLE